MPPGANCPDAETGDRPNEAEALTNLGDAHAATGDEAGAHEAWRAALDILDELGHADAELVRARLPGRTGPPLHQW
jgi:hypothetical protein